jgi:hypothetical protein
VGGLKTAKPDSNIFADTPFATIGSPRRADAKAALTTEEAFQWPSKRVKIADRRMSRRQCQRVGEA